MTDNLIQFEGGDILANLEERTITGLLLPYNEEGRTNVGRFQVEAGAVAIPADPIVVGLNTDHDRPATVGRAIRLQDTDRGVLATFQFANTPEGDAALQDAVTPGGRRRKLSAEFGPAVIKAGKLVAGHARLWGAALVEAGAFPSAQVLAQDTPDVAPPEAVAEALVVTVDALPTSITAVTPGGESADYISDDAPADAANLVVTVDALPASITATTSADESAVYTPEATPAEEITPEEGGATVPNEVTAGATRATIPNTLHRTQPVHVEARAKFDLPQVFAAIAELKANPGAEGARQVLAALTNITMTGSNSLPASGVIRENWLGELYQGITYEREYITLGTLGTDISAGGKKGFKTKRGTSGTPIAGPDGIPNGGTWAGNKAEINSYNGFTQTAASTLLRFAVGDDIGREFYDLPGGLEVVEAFLKLLIEDHLYWSDVNALAAIVTAAGAPVAPDTAKYSTAYPDSIGQVIQGILAVKAKKADQRRDIPTFGILNEAAYEEIAYAAGGEENMPAFVSLALSTNSEGTADGTVQLVQGDIGIDNTPAVLVGARRGIEFDELPGGPLHVDALHLANGGIDRAVHGYLQTFPVRPEAFVLVGTADV